jgi:hypothetical protein
MSGLKIKQISNSGSPPDSYIAFNGAMNVWQKIRHVVEFTSADLVNGVLTVQHDLGRKYVVVTVYDEDDFQIVADQVKVFDDVVEIYLNSFNVTNWVAIIS